VQFGPLDCVGLGVIETGYEMLGRHAAMPDMVETPFADHPVDLETLVPALDAEAAGLTPAHRALDEAHQEDDAEDDEAYKRRVSKGKRQGQKQSVISPRHSRIP
jgi:hypothetical protein